MNIKQANKIATLAIESVADGRPVTLKRRSMLFVNPDGTFNIVINEEEMDELDKDQAIQMIVKNLTEN